MSLVGTSRQLAQCSDMRYGFLAVILIGATMLGGCTDGVLDPKGPIALAERQILLNALGIMTEAVECT